jgi:hypothetical protein
MINKIIIIILSMIIISLFSINNGADIFTSAIESENDTISFIGDLIVDNDTGSISIAHNATFIFSKGKNICPSGNCAQELMNTSLYRFVSDNYLMKGTLNIKDIPNSTINNKEWKSWLLEGIFEVFDWKRDMENNQEIEFIMGSINFLKEHSSKPISYNITGKIILSNWYYPQSLTFEGKSHASGIMNE